MPSFSLRRRCLICKAEFTIDHPRRSYCSSTCRKEQFRLWDKERAHVKNLRTKKKSWTEKRELLVFLGAKCQTCGVSDLRTLEFSHVDAKTKHRRLRKREKMYPSTRWRILRGEAQKGLVVLECANCHRIKTHNEFWKNEIIT